MADIPQLLSNYDALIGVALGAGLTYGFGTLNRRHQEARERDTRWYDARLQAYIAFYQAVYEVFFRLGQGKVISEEVSSPLLQRLLNDLGTVQFVGSPEVIALAEKTWDLTFEQIRKEVKGGRYSTEFIHSLDDFQEAARKDLGHSEHQAVFRAM